MLAVRAIMVFRRCDKGGGAVFRESSRQSIDTIGVPLRRACDLSARSQRQTGVMGAIVKQRVGLAWVLLCWVTVAAASADLRVGTTGDYPPFSFLDTQTGQYQGSDIDQARALAAALQRRLVVVPTTWRTLASDLAAGRFDIAMGGVSVNAQRAAQGVFTAAYLQDGKTPLVRCDEVARFQSVEQINRPDVRLVVNPGGTNERFAREQLAQANLRIFADNVTIFDEIEAKRADVMVTDAIEARLQQRLRPGLCAVHPEHPFDRTAKAYWLPAGSALLPAVQRWLAGSIRRGEAGGRLQYWLAYDWRPDIAQTAAVRQLLTLIDERLALMPEVARYKWNSSAAIEDLPREQALLESVRGQALQRGLNADTVTAFFAAQIEASKVVQRELFSTWQAAGQGKFAQVVDLGTQIRPRLDQLNPSLLDALAAVRLPVAGSALPQLSFAASSPAAAAVSVGPLSR
jgi:chorismate mutase-like protein